MGTNSNQNITGDLPLGNNQGYWLNIEETNSFFRVEERSWALFGLCVGLLDDLIGLIWVRCSPLGQEVKLRSASFLTDQTVGNARWVVPQSKIAVLKERGMHAGQAKGEVPTAVFSTWTSNPGPPWKDHSLSLVVSWFFPRRIPSADSCSQNVKV